jgi:hypothetical protein
MPASYSTATLGLIETAGECLPNGVLLEPVRGEGSNEIGFLAHDGDRERISRRVEYGDKSFVPASADPTILRALRLPTRIAPYTSTRELFDQIRKLLASYHDLTNQTLLQIVYFIFGTWLADRVPNAPFLWIVAPATAPRRMLLQLLSLLCRHSLLLTAENPAGLWALPMQWRPTLLLDTAELSVPVLKFLRASNSQGVRFPKTGQVLDLYCAKAICSPEPLRDPSLASSALQITLPPVRGELPAWSEEASHQIAEEFQAKLLMYRINSYAKVRLPDFSHMGLTAPTQSLARSLAACIVDDDQLQEGLLPLLRERDEESQIERRAGLESVILEALLCCCHEAGRSSVRGAEVAELANTILARRGETLQISPETVGHRLKFLRFRTEPIGSGGRGLWLMGDVRAAIHKLAPEYGVQHDPVIGCTHCRGPIISPQKPEKRAGGDERIQNHDDEESSHRE